jgi:hypothetical protein
MVQYLCVAVVYVGYLLRCILVIFDVMTHLMICDIGLLRVCCIFCMPVLEVPQLGDRQNRQKKLKNLTFIGYVHRLT